MREKNWLLVLYKRQNWLKQMCSLAKRMFFSDILVSSFIYSEKWVKLMSCIFDNCYKLWGIFFCRYCSKFFVKDFYIIHRVFFFVFLCLIKYHGLRELPSLDTLIQKLGKWYLFIHFHFCLCVIVKICHFWFHPVLQIVHFICFPQQSRSLAANDALLYSVRLCYF